MQPGTEAFLAPGLRAVMKQGGHVAWIVCLLLALIVWRAPGTQAAPLRTGQIQIVSVDASAYPRVNATVVVRDAFGRGVGGLMARDFIIEDHGRVVPVEQVQLTPVDEPSAVTTVAIVADLSVLLGSQAIDEVRNDVYLLLTHLLHHAGHAEVALFVPRSNVLDQSLIVAPFTTDLEEALRALEETEPRTGRTDLYNTVVAAANASADRAMQRGGPAYVVVLSDGQDRTSIVGSGIVGANEAARLAEERRVPVFAFGYGRRAERGAALMAQVADRTGGVYLPDPPEEEIAAFTNTMLTSARAGAYELTYQSSLSADGAEHPLTIRVLVDNLPLAAEARYLAPRSWDGAAPQQLDVQIDARAYPEVTLLARPVNQLRRTVPDLSADDFRVSIDGSPLTTTPNVVLEPLDAHDPTASQSVALVVDLRAVKARETAVALLQAPTDIPMRVALFVPGLPGPPPAFTHDRNAIINTLNLVRVDNGSAVGATLLLAIDAVAHDADAHARPAYVVLITDEPLPSDLRARAVTEARDQRVTISTITMGAEDDTAPLARLAAATGGQHITRPDPLQLAAIAETIAQDRAARYRITFQAPLIADGVDRTVTLGVGNLTADMPLTPLIVGDASLRPPVTVTLKALIFGGVALVLIVGALLPRIVSDRRLRCPSCGRVRRASWGNACLFCEMANVEGNAGRGTDVSLEGFAIQGASLVATPARAATPVRATSKPSTNGAGEQHPPSDLSRTKDLRVLDPEPSAAPSGSPSDNMGVPVHESQPPAFTNGTRGATHQDPEQARMQSHTDFWGPLPDEEAPGSPAASTDLPAAVAWRDEETLPPALPVFELLAAPDATVSGLRVWEAPTGLRESTHTDFWGPLPDDHTADEGILEDAGNSEAPVCAQPESTVSHTDFWGPLPDEHAADNDMPEDVGNGEAPVCAQPESTVSHTDFWGPLPGADAPEETHNGRAKKRGGQ